MEIYPMDNAILLSNTWAQAIIWKPAYIQAIAISPSNAQIVQRHVTSVFM